MYSRLHRVAAAHRLSLAVASGRWPLAAVPGLLTAGASLAAGQSLWSLGSGAVAHRLRCSATSWIFPDQGSNLRPLHWQVGSQPRDHQASHALSCLKKSFPFFYFFIIFLYQYGLRESPALHMDSLHWATWEVFYMAFSAVQSLSRVWLFATPWTAAR